ncbi:uncharacterized protein LOC116270095 [Papio anubis]|uniref:uncharacterized protein LOC116270095 n=1 Tax=Papio anubis TaxID=9555 RepID=UPI0012AD4323|nr:uncharacterized protein LOC116270095 [Papio anubis]
MPEPAPSTCWEVWRERCGQEPRLHKVLTVQRKFRWAWGVGVAQAALPAQGSEGLSTLAGSCGGCTWSPSTASWHAPCSNSSQASAASPLGRAQDLRSAMPQPPPTTVGSCAARPSPTSTAPCAATPSPIDRPRAEECRHAARDWPAALPAALVQDPLGEASWAPGSSGDLENFYVWLRDCGCINQYSVSSSRFVNTPISTLYLANLVGTWRRCKKWTTFVFNKNENENEK